MAISQITPFRQLARAYSALLNISSNLSALPHAVHGTERALASIKEALAPADAQTLKRRIDELEKSFDARVSKAIRDHLYLPQPSHWSADKPFLPFSTCSAADFIHPQYATLCEQLQHPVQFHRKLWEWVFVLHHLEQQGMLKPDMRAVGFGVGQERMPSLFASRGVEVVATDAPPEIGRSSGWTATGQHSDSLKELYYSTLVSRDVFDVKVSHRFCDMNAISDDLTGFDFTWSCCSFEHLGSLEAGMKFVINSVEKTLKPGGVAVHTTEFNLSSNDETIDKGHTVLYRARDMEELVSRLRDLGHEVQPFVVAPDSHFLDFHVDLPPYADAPHLKIKFGRHVTTSAGLVIRKRSQ
jgi:SAM-dependent methyltransferase